MKRFFIIVLALFGFVSCSVNTPDTTTNTVTDTTTTTNTFDDIPRYTYIGSYSTDRTDVEDDINDCVDKWREYNCFDQYMASKYISIENKPDGMGSYNYYTYGGIDSGKWYVIREYCRDPYGNKHYSEYIIPRYY